MRQAQNATQTQQLLAEDFRERMDKVGRFIRKEYGVAPEMQAGINDHALVIAARDLMRMRQNEPGHATLLDRLESKKVTRRTRTMKPGTQRTMAETNSSNAKQAIRRAKKIGSGDARAKALYTKWSQ